MKTKEEITEIVSTKLYQAEYDALVFSDLSGFITGLSVKRQDKLIAAVLEGRDAEVGKFLREGMVVLAQTNAQTKATSLMADDSLSLSELQKIF